MVNDMTREMKQWLRDRGLTASKVADNIGVSRNEFYTMLDGRVSWWMSTSYDKVRHALINYYGMTEQEFRSFIRI